LTKWIETAGTYPGSSLNPTTMTRIKSMSASKQLAPPPVASPEPPTQPGIWTKLLPDGRVVPWIVLPEVETGIQSASNRPVGGCYKCTN